MMATRAIEPDFPPLDEGWWASVLAEDELRFVSGKPAAPAPSSGNIRVNWALAMQIFQRDEILTLQVVDYNRGGLLVQGEALSGFVPCSHLIELPPQATPEQRERCFQSYVGRLLKLKIIECVPQEERLVFSERAARAEPGKRPLLFGTLQAGQIVTGVITNITNFGAFVDLGGVEGLIHLSELSWGRVSHPSQIVQIGQTVQALVLEVAPERCRIALSLKRLQPNPWETAESRYPLHAVVSAEITDIVPYGIFVRLEEGLEGLVHNSELVLPKGTTVSEYFHVGQRVQVRIIQMDAARQRLGLSMRLLN
ncbi:MAG: S1 RNA-binding domain-containing protein [Anaerolineales bacterium]|nr:S1 RNA-binding domain-containing protein [Anaerolineales bacterium]MCX7609148.1 S1 RNA-binding domain-containing protein [Anaerolineales bacterium]MDW8227532.1 S1 RNA-binding domain-containing protein [Anaerolineales bacterium]